MFLTARKAALAGITLTISFILMLLGSIIEVSTLFFLTAAAFCIGIVIRELGIRMGAAFLAASILLGLFLAPNKLYVLTYGMIEGYLLLREIWWTILENRIRQRTDVPGEAEQRQPGRKAYFLGKAVLAQLLIWPLVLSVPQLFYAGELTWLIRGLLIVAGEAFWLVADTAYDVFQRQLWGKFRRHLDWIP